MEYISLGNPPYIKNLHLEVLKKCLSVSSDVQIIHPSGWLYRTTKQIEKEVKRDLKGRVAKLTIFNGNTTFSEAEFQAPLVITNAKKSHKGPIEIHYKTTGNTYCIDSLDEFPSGFWEPKPAHLDLISKVKSLLKTTGNLNNLSEKYSNQEYFLKCPAISGDGRSKDATKMCKDDFWTFFYNGSDFYSKKKNAPCFVLNSKEEVENLKSYLATKFARFCLSIEKVTVHLYIKRYLQNVPVPPLDREWDDESVYNYFNISQEERNYINSFIPDFYV